MSKRLASAAELEERLTALQDSQWSDGESEDESGEESGEEELEDLNKEVLSLKKQKTTKLDPSERSAVVYIGHIPHGFYEDQMRGFFSQFGTVKQVRMSRSKKTGRSKGYAFIEFGDVDVAEVVADAMDKYILEGKQLVVKQLKIGQVHPKLWKGADKPFTVTVKSVLTKKMKIHNKEHTDDERITRTVNLLRNEESKRKRLADLGIEYNFPGFAAHAAQMSTSQKQPEQSTHTKSPTTTPESTSEKTLKVKASKKQNTSAKKPKTTRINKGK